MPPLREYRASYAVAQNQPGDIAGFVEDGDGSTRAVLWSRSKVIDLGSLGGRSSKAWAINDRGDVAGEAMIPGDARHHACLWCSRQPTDLTPDAANDSAAYAISDAGDVGGSEQDQIAGVSNAFIFRGHAHLRLSIPGSSSAAITGLSKAGAAVGWMTSPESLRRAVMWHTREARDLGGPTGNRTWALAVNDLGAAVGGWQPEIGSTPPAESYYQMLPVHATLWQRGRMEDLGTLQGISSEAFGINNLGQVVGQFVTSQGESRAFWRHGWTAIDLNTLIPTGSGWVLKEATSINDAGQICGTGEFHGAVRGFMLVRHVPTAG